jgi:hypothetical protein
MSGLPERSNNLRTDVLLTELYQSSMLLANSHLRGLQTRRSKANRILRILRLDAEDRGLRPSRTIYKKWGNGEKMCLQVSKICRSAVVG